MGRRTLLISRKKKKKKKKKNARKDGRSVFSRSFLILFHSHFEIIVMVVRTEPSIQERRSLVQRTVHAHTGTLVHT